MASFQPADKLWNRTFIGLLAGVGQLESGPDVVKPRQSGSSVHADYEVVKGKSELVTIINP